MAIHIGDKHIVLVGMMGTGKTAVGQALARRLGRPFIDTDRLVEAREGRSVAELFQERGEAYFRDTECAAIREATDASPSVIATGGGALLRQENREALRKRSLIIWLKADLPDLARRVARGGAKRPMLKGAGSEERLRQLLKEREPVYAEADWSMDTTGKSVTDVVQAILHRIEGGGTMKQEGR